MHKNSFCVLYLVVRKQYNMIFKDDGKKWKNSNIMLCDERFFFLFFTAAAAVLVPMFQYQQGT